MDKLKDFLYILRHFPKYAKWLFSREDEREIEYFSGSRFLHDLDIISVVSFGFTVSFSLRLLVSPWIYDAYCLTLTDYFFEAYSLKWLLIIFSVSVACIAISRAVTFFNMMGYRASAIVKIIAIAIALVVCVILAIAFFTMIVNDTPHLTAISFLKATVTYAIAFLFIVFILLGGVLSLCFGAIAIIFEAYTNASRQAVYAIPVVVFLLFNLAICVEYILR